MPALRPAPWTAWCHGDERFLKSARPSADEQGSESVHMEGRVRATGRGIVANAVASVIVVACLTVLTACIDRAELEQVRREAEQSHADLERRQAVVAVEVVRLNFEQFYGGRGHGPAPTIAAQLVQMMNAAEGSKRTFTYVADTVTGPWQVVIKADGDALHVAAYGSQTAQPVERITLAVRR
jgi:hypothetical protein